MAIRTHVGRNQLNATGFNGPEDVRTIRILLGMQYPHAALGDSTQVDASLITWIEQFQRDVVHMPEPDGFISPRGRSWRRLVDATSGPRFRLLVDHCVERPSFRLLRMAYDAYRGDSQPCKRGITNQCAIRLSIALFRCGIDLTGRDSLLHTGARRCGTTIPHLAGANSLARILCDILGTPQRFTHQHRALARERLQGQTGIVYFDNCFTRDGAAAKLGDHIDLWTGDHSFNQLIHVGAGGDAGPSARLFSEADDGVWFWQLN